MDIYELKDKLFDLEEKLERLQDEYLQKIEELYDEIKLIEERLCEESFD